MGGNLGLPLLLLAAMWGLFSPILKAVEMMNERRDKILDPESKLTVSHRRLMLWSDWLTIFLASYGFIAFIGFLVYYSPHFIESAQAGFSTEGAIIYKITGGILVIVTVVGLVAGWFDFNYMRRYLNNLEKAASAAEPPAETKAGEQKR